MATVISENRWLFAVVTISIWIALFLALEFVLFGEELLTGVVRGAAGGIAFVFIYTLLSES